MSVWRAASKLCAVRSRERASRCRLRAGRACAGGSAQPGQRARSAGSAAPGGTAIHQSAEASAHRSQKERWGLSVSRTAERQVRFVHFELVRQGPRLEPVLQTISDFLDDQKDMIEQVRPDLTRGLKKAGTGRNGPRPQQAFA